MEILTITLKVEGWDKSKTALLPGGRHWLCFQRVLEFSVSEPGVESPALNCGVPSHHAPCAVVTLRIYHCFNRILLLTRLVLIDLFLLFHRALPTGTERLGPLPCPTIFTQHLSLGWPPSHFCETAVVFIWQVKSKLHIGQWFPQIHGKSEQT